MNSRMLPPECKLLWQHHAREELPHTAYMANNFLCFFLLRVLVADWQAWLTSACMCLTRQNNGRTEAHDTAVCAQVPEHSPAPALLSAAQLEELAARMGSVSLTPSLKVRAACLP